MITDIDGEHPLSVEMGLRSPLFEMDPPIGQEVSISDRSKPRGGSLYPPLGQEVSIPDRSKPRGDAYTLPLAKTCGSQICRNKGRNGVAGGSLDPFSSDFRVYFLYKCQGKLKEIRPSLRSLTHQNGT